MIKKVVIKYEYITLGQFLKLVDLINNGGEAKFFLSENQVIINNEEDNRRGRKLYKGDILKTLNKEYQIC